MPDMNLRRWWLVSLMLGVLGGVLWWAITETATWTITKDGTSISNDETRLQFGAIVNFVLIGTGGCLLLGFAVAYVSQVSWTAIPLVGILSGQAAVVAWLVGGLLGPDEPKRKGPVGSQVHDALSVDAVAPFFAWAVFGIAGLLIGMVLVEHHAAHDEAGVNRR